MTVAIPDARPRKNGGRRRRRANRRGDSGILRGRGRGRRGGATQITDGGGDQPQSLVVELDIDSLDSAFLAHIKTAPLLSVPRASPSMHRELVQALPGIAVQASIIVIADVHVSLLVSADNLRDKTVRSSSTAIERRRVKDKLGVQGRVVRLVPSKFVGMHCVVAAEGPGFGSVARAAHEAWKTGLEKAVRRRAKRHDDVNRGQILR